MEETFKLRSVLEVRVYLWFEIQHYKSDESFCDLESKVKLCPQVWVQIRRSVRILVCKGRRI